MNLEEIIKTANKNIKQAHKTADKSIKQAHKSIKLLAMDVKNGKSTGNEVFDFLILDNYNQGPAALLDLIKQTKGFQEQLENHRGQYILAVYEQRNMTESGGLTGLGTYETIEVKEWGKIAETGNVLLIEPDEEDEENKIIRNKIIRINTNGIYNHESMGGRTKFYSTRDGVFYQNKKNQITKHNMAYDPTISCKYLMSPGRNYAFGKTLREAGNVAEKIAEKGPARSKYAFADDEED